MPVADVHDLRPDARAVVDRYLQSFSAGLCGVEKEIAEEALDGVRAHILEQLATDSGAPDAERVVAEMGAPDDDGAALCAAISDDDPVSRAAGTLLGVPYDLRLPTARRVASRWWDPYDRRVFVPRVFGIGWSLNFAAVAVRAGWIEPDAEDEPFASTPNRAFAVALAVPVALTAALLASYLVVRAQLPDLVPVHWGLSGAPDRFAPVSTAFLPLLAIAVVPTAWATWSVIARRQPLLRGATIALASMFSALSLGIWALTMLTATTAVSSWWLPALCILPCLAFPLIVLVWLARAGRAVEIRRDGAASKGESA